MLRGAQSHAEELAKLGDRLKNGIDFWEEPLLNSSKLEEIMKSIKRLKDFFDSLKNYSTVGKLRI
jgi:hypothetical protein